MNKINNNTIIITNAKAAKTRMKVLSAIIMNISFIGSSFAPTYASEEYKAKMANAFALFAIGVGRQGGVNSNGQAQCLGSANAYFNDVNSKAQTSNNSNHRYLALIHSYLLLLKQDILRVQEYSTTNVDPLILSSLLKAHEVNPNYTYDYDSRLNNPQFVQIGLNNMKEAIDSIPVEERTQFDQSIGVRTISALSDRSVNEWTEERFLRHWNPDAPVVIILSPQAGPRTNDPALIQLCGAIGNLAHGIAPSGELHERLRVISINGLQATDSFSGTNQVLIALYQTTNMLGQPLYEQELSQKLFDIRRVSLSLDKIQSLPVGELTTRLKKIHRDDLTDYRQSDLLRKINNERLPCDTIRELIPSIGNGNEGEKTLPGLIISDSHSRFIVSCTEAKTALEDYERSSITIPHSNTQNNNENNNGNNADQSNNNELDTASCNNNNASTSTARTQSNQTLQQITTPQVLQNEAHFQRQLEQRNQSNQNSAPDTPYPSRAESIALTGGIQPYVPRISIPNTNLNAHTLHSGIAAWRIAQAMQEDRESLINHTYEEDDHNADTNSPHIIENNQNNAIQTNTQPAQQTGRAIHNDTVTNGNIVNSSNINNNVSSNMDTVPTNLYSNPTHHAVRPLPSNNNRQQIMGHVTNENDDDSTVYSFSTVSSADPASTARSVPDVQFVMIQQGTDTVSTTNTNTTDNTHTVNPSNVNNAKNTSNNNAKQ